MTIQDAWNEHADELDTALTALRKAEVLLRWRKAIDLQAHDYADLVAGHPSRDEIAAVESEAIMHAFFCGYMAGRGWVTADQARQASYQIGRTVRDRLRDLGFRFDDVSPAVGMVMNDTLVAITELAWTTYANEDTAAAK